MSDTGVAVTIDVSNRRTGIVIWNGPDRPRALSLSTEPNRTVDELVVLAGGMLAPVPSAVAGCAIACVVPSLEGVILAAAQTLFGIEPIVVRPGVRTGLDIRTENPREVGPDRIASAVAAIGRCGSPVIVIDIATALTFDVIGPAGDYLGAIIAPGPEVALEALVDRTARLGPIDLAADLDPTPIAGSTAEAIRTGILGGTIGTIQGLVTKIREEVGPAPAIATGELPLAATIAARCPVIEHFDPLLTHRGLLAILSGTTLASNVEHTADVQP